MKKITEVPGLKDIKQRRGLKIASALSIALPIFSSTIQRSSAAISKYSGSSAIQSVKGINRSLGTNGHYWGYVVLTGRYAGQHYSQHVGWTDSNGDRYYCLNPNERASVEDGSNRTAERKAANASNKIRAALYLGYGVNSAKSLGVTGSYAANKAEYGTQLAIWHILGYTTAPADPGVSKVYNHILSNLSKYEKKDGTTTLSIETGSTNTQKAEKTITITGKEFGKDLDGSVDITVSGAKATQGSKVITKSGKLELGKKVTLKATGKPVAGKTTTTTDKDGNKVETTPYTIAAGSLTATRPKYTLVAPTYNNGAGYQAGVKLVGLKTGGNISKKVTVKGGYNEKKTYTKVGGSERPNITVERPQTPQGGQSSESVKVRARIYKKDDEGKPVPGVEFTIYKSNDDYERGLKVETITTGSDGYATTSQLAPGYYIAIETKTNGNLELDDTHVDMDLNDDTLDATDDNTVKTETTKGSNGKDITLYTATFNGPTNNHKSPEVLSKATNDDDNTQTGQPIDGPVTINEKLLFKYLIEGQKYKVRSWLVDQETGQKIQVAGKGVESEETFEAPKSDSNYNSSKDIKLTIPNAKTLAGKKAVVYSTVTRVSNGKQTDHKDINDKDETVEFTSPSLHTNAYDQADKDKTFVPTKDQKLTDKITYSGLIKGKKYTVKGTLIDKTTGKAVQVDGKDVTFEKEFTASDSTSTVDSDVKFDASALSGSKLVVYETLYYGGHKLADHSDINDKAQSVTVSIPKAKVKILKKDDEDHTVSGVKFNIYKSTANWEKGDLVETVTTDKDGYAESSELPLGYYIAVESETVKNLIIDTTPVKIDLNESVLRNSQATQKVEGNTLVFTSDANGPLNNHIQPELASQATNFEDGSQTMQPIEGPVTINEHLFFNHLVESTEYTVNAWLIDKATGQPILEDGKKVETSKVIKSGSDDKYADGIRGEADLQLSIKNASKFAGKDIVVYSTIARTSKPDHYTTLHQDINDAAETVHFTTPDLHTNASNAETKTQQVQPTNKETINDKVSYTGLVKGKTYKVVGTVIDKATGKPIEVDGHTLTFSRTFKATGTSGYVNLGTSFDARDYKGKSLVVFENLYYNDKLLKEHKNINDVDQTLIVTTPELHTTLSESAQKLVVPKKENVVEDVVSYRDLVAGQTYTVSGKLIDQATGKPIMYNGKYVTASKTFKAPAANGNVTVTFKFKGQDLQGHSLVAFEDLTYNNRELVKHADLSDVAQTVTVDHNKPAIIKTPTPGPTTTITTTLPQTGNSKDTLTQLAGMATLVVTIGSAVYFIRRHQSTGLD